MQEERNYINAIVEFYEDGIQTEVIFKVGEVDLDDDMHVFAYLKSEDEIDDLLKKGNEEFRVMEYWKGLRQKRKSQKTASPEEWDAFFGVPKIPLKPKPK